MVSMIKRIQREGENLHGVSLKYSCRFSVVNWTVCVNVTSRAIPDASTLHVSLSMNSARVVWVHVHRA